MYDRCISNLKVHVVAHNIDFKHIRKSLVCLCKHVKIRNCSESDIIKNKHGKQSVLYNYIACPNFAQQLDYQCSELRLVLALWKLYTEFQS